MEGSETVDDSGTARRARERPLPAVMVVWSGAAPCLRILPLERGALTLGRDETRLPDDDRLSRKHAEIGWNGQKWTVRDLGSRNGTHVDGKRIEGARVGEAPRVVRVGRTLLVLLADARAILDDPAVTIDELVRGPTSRRALARIEQIARAGDHLLITGETGSGKEHAARAFHTGGGPFVVVNCATVPEGVAERLLFGARKGAFSGATDAEGFLAAANGGVLFLDEIGELELDVQAKLLRVLETREVVPLGATTGKKLDLRFCFATHRDLRAAVDDGRFREDLYHRIAHPQVAMPPLRERPEELPWLLTTTIAKVRPELSLHTTFVEACLSRTWPGNVRELQHHARAAAHAAIAARETVITHEHLDPEAGRARQSEPSARTSRVQVEEALSAEGGNVAAAARSLGLHRTQLYRLLERFGIRAGRDGG